MRQPTILLLAATVAVLLNSMANAADRIHWATNLEEARSLALQQNKLLLIHFSTPDCGPCKVVEKKVFPTPGVAQTINRHYVPLKVNAYQDTALRDHFGVRQWPTDIVATVDGKAVHRMVTEQDPNRYVQKLSAVAMQNRSMVPSHSHQAVRVAQVPTQQFLPNNYQAPTSPKWSNTITPPDLTDNSARARRPGIDPAMRPGFEPPLGGPMMPTVQSPAQTPQAFAQQPGRFVNPTTPAAGRNITNRFANNNSPLTVPHPTMRQEVSNPYTRNQMAQSPVPSSAPNVQPAQQLARPTPQKPIVQQPISPRQLAKPQQHFARQFNASQQAMPTRNAPGAMNSPLAAREHASLPTPSTDTPVLGLDGRCPVTLVSRSKWVKGNAQWGAMHRGHTYLFAGAEEQQRFLANPDEYSPVLAGMDVVALAERGRVIQGNRRYGVLYDDDGPGPRPSRIYLFDSVATRNQFESRPENFVQPVMQAMQEGRLESLLR